MVQEARDQLMSNETQEELKEVFEGSCKLIPIKLISMECIKVFDGFIPELVEMLSSQMNPAVVCTTAGLCNSDWSDRLQSEYHAAQLAETNSKDDKCHDCNNFMSSLVEKIQHKGKEDVLTILFDICGRMGSLSDGCHAIVLDNIDEIYNSLQMRLGGKGFCQLYGICNLKLKKSDTPQVDIQPMSNDVKFESKMPFEVKSKDDLECEFCEALVKHVREIVTTNTTEEEFKQVILALCKQTGSFAKQCVSLTTQYYDVMYAFLAQEMDPKQVCRLLTLCPNPGLLGAREVASWYLKIQTTPTIVPLSRLFPAEKISEEKNAMVDQDKINTRDVLRGDDESQLPIERVLPTAVAAVTANKNPGCIFCEYVLHQIVDELHNTTIDKNIEQVVKNICNRLPSAISDECDKFVDNYGDALLFLLSQELDPSVACATLQLCPAAENEVVLPRKPFRASMMRDPNVCALCEFVITELDHRLEENKTEAAIKQALENICGYMPKSVRKDCTRLVDAYADQILEMLLADLTPDEVCAALKFCKPKMNDAMGFKTSHDISLGEFLTKMQVEPFHSANQAKIVKTVSPATCIMCEFAMKELDKLLITNSTEEQVKRTIYFVCGHLPDTVADMCIDFVEQYGDEIFDMLVKEMAPKEVCSEMGLCAAVSNKLKVLGQEELQMEHIGFPKTCTVCETIVEYLDKLLEDDTIEESIDQIVEKACKIIPSNAQAKCKGIVDTYGPYLLHQLGMMMDKTKVCQSVHLCKPPAGQVQLLGGKFCTFGPAYWCVSKEHAIACNELEHCQAKEWMKLEP